ncbi:aldo/keto reductase [Mycoplasmatota bacterium WC44]
MEKRKFNKLGIETSLLGFGCMRFPLTDNGEIDKVKSFEMIDTAIMSGVNYIDTAWPYHDEESERFVGEVLKRYDRSSLYLATKLPIWLCKTKEDVEKYFSKQLEKLETDYIDFYLIHAVNKERLAQINELEVLEVLRRLKYEGKIKYIGFSFHDDLDTFKLCVDLYEWDFVQIQLNYMDVNHQQGIEGYNILTEKGIPCIIMEPIKGGSLANFRNDVEKLLLDVEPNMSIASWAFRWVGSFDNVKVILSGMSTLDQVKDNVNTFSNFKKLNNKEFILVEKVSDTLNSLQVVSCTNCKYCMPCEYGVDIPRNFSFQNHYEMYRNEDGVKWVVNRLNDNSAFANVCVECNECIPKCPQNIQIPQELSKINKIFSSLIK